MYKIVLGVLIWIFGLTAAWSAPFGNIDPNSYMEVTVKNGDGITIILNRYNLASYACNVAKFCELNNISLNDQLILGKTYKLPIKIYNYNGKSIRSTINDNDIEKALRIQKYNEDILARGLRSSTFQQSKLLWVPIHEVDCEGSESSNVKGIEEEKISKKAETLSSKLSSDNSVGSATENLFGDKHSNFTLFDNALKGQVFYLVSGHGGPDPGAMCIECVEAMCEDEYAYDVTLRLARNLMQHGAIVHVIIQDKNDGIRDEKYLKCDNDEVINSGKKLPLRQLDRLKQRADAINNLHSKYKKQGVKSQKAIMIHVDSRAKEKRQDVFFYYHDSNSGGKELAHDVYNTFEEKYGMYRKDKTYAGYVDNRGLYMLRKVVPSSVYVELANIRNSTDHKRLIYDYNRQALANWLFEGMTGIK